MTCRDCKLWNIEEAKDRAGRVRKDRVAKCLWEPKERWPKSAVLPYPRLSYMAPYYGEGCPCFVKRESNP